MPHTTRLIQAETLIEAAKERARKIDVPINIAVVDTGADLVAFARMDGAWLGSIEIAQNKAYTARAFDMSTKGSLPKLASRAIPLLKSPAAPIIKSQSLRVGYPSSSGGRSSESAVASPIKITKLR